jgi:hypothetical protein
MAEAEMLQEQTRDDAGASHTDLLIAIAAPLSSTVLASTVEKLEKACGLLSAPFQAALAIPGDIAHDGPVVVEGQETPAHPLRLLKYDLPPADPGAIPWLANNAASRNISALASQLGVRACTLLGSDLDFTRETLTAERLTLLLDPALEGTFDLVMPLYTTRPFDDLVNKSILYPLTRALYGHRVRNPLGNELQMSARLLPAISAESGRDSTRQGRLPWPATVAANRNLKICQVQLGSRRPQTADGVELSDALAQLASPLFLNLEDYAAFWQRVRGSHDVPTFGNSEPAEATADTVDMRPMVEAFQLGARNLREIWGLILPPVTLLELKKLSLQTSDEFHMPDALWTRIVYDFALAHRLRNIHRAHLFGALTPLYLGWVASYAIEINRAGIATADDRVEQLARTYELEKPYLLSRWRWPDRFHP